MNGPDQSQPQPEAVGKRLREQRLRWESSLVMMLVMPLGILYLIFESISALMIGSPSALPLFSLPAIPALGISTIFAYLVWRLRAATGQAAICGGILTACIYYGSIRESGTVWVHSGIAPLFMLFVLTYAATRYRRKLKEQQGTAEAKAGRNGAQVCANLGVAALIQAPFLFTPHIFNLRTGTLWLAPMLAALVEATADTVSSEIGQAVGGSPRMLTTLRRVPAGTDGAISLAGTTAGCVAAVVVVGVAAATMRLDLRTAAIALSAGFCGLFFDSLLGATVERRGYLNNDAVNFLSTLAAALAAALTAALSAALSAALTADPAVLFSSSP